MTINDAKSKYDDAVEKAGGNPPFEDLVGQLIDSGYNQEFDNDSYFDALWLTHHMLNRTYKSIDVLTGGAGEVFFEKLGIVLSNALERVRKNGGRARIVFLNPPSPYQVSIFNQLSLQFPGVFSYKTAKANGPISHFFICDQKMVRIERPHSELTGDSSASEVCAKVNFNDPMLAEIKSRLFEKIWQKLAPTACA